MSVLIKIPLLILAGLATTAGFAQIAEDDLAKQLEALLNTPVQGASKRDQRLLDSPQGIEVLNGDEIRRMGIYRLVDALRLMTSVDVLELDNHVTNISLRGAMQQGQPRNVQILIDGVPLYNAELAGVDVDNLPVTMDLVDKIEVVRGPSSSLYGANAVVGVIAITTRRAAQGAAGGIRVSAANLSTTRGSADVELGSRTAGLTLGYQGAALGASRQNTADLYTGRPVVIDQDGSHQDQLFARGTWSVGDASFWAGGGDATKQVGTASYLGYPAQTFTTRTLNAGWGQAWTSRFHTEVRYSHLLQQDQFGASSVLANAFSDPGLAGGSYSWARIATHLAELQANWEISPELHAVGGLDYRRSSTDASIIIGLPAIKDSATGGFLNLDWNVTRSVTLSGGLRVENDSLGGSRTSPRLVALWNPSPDSSLRAGYYSSSRSPQELESRVNFLNTFGVDPASLGLPANTPTQGIFQILPNPQLKPEQVTSTELGYRQKFGAFSVDLTLFSMKFSDLISQEPAPSNPNPVVVPTDTGVTVYVYNQYVNTQSATDRGAELTATWRPSPHWSCGGNATWLEFRMDATAASPASTPSYTPGFKGNLWTRFTVASFSGYLGYSHVGRVNMDVLGVSGNVSPEVPRAAVDQLSLNLGWHVGPGFTLAVYAMDALKAFTDQGGGAPARLPYVMAARREAGATLGCRF